MQPISSPDVQPGGAATQALRIRAQVGVGSSLAFIIIHKLTYATEYNPTTVTGSIQCERTTRAGSGRFRRIPTWPDWRSIIGFCIARDVCRISFRTGERNICSLRFRILRQCFVSDAMIVAMTYFRREAAPGVQPKTSITVGV